MDCLFTLTVLSQLIECRAPVRLVCLPGPDGLSEPLVQRPPSRASLGIVQPARESVTALAHRHGIDVWRLGDLESPGTLEAIEAVAADVAIIACFSRRIPKRLAATFPLGAINIHPSLLPDKRGPDPQFWTLKDGMGEAGVTLHRLSRRFDAGPIVAQQRIGLPDGATEHELDRLTATAGAEMLLGLMPTLVAGTLEAAPQREDSASYAPHPSLADYRLDPSRPARAAFNFARGVRSRGVPILVEIDGLDWVVEEAVAYWPDAGAVMAHAGQREVLIEFNPGILLARVRATDARR